MITPLFFSPVKQIKKFSILAFAFLPLILAQPSTAETNSPNSYMTVTGLIDLRSTFSDGAHSIEEIVRMAESRGFNAVFINDHDRISLSYGIPPFRNIFRYKKKYPSIMTNGPDQFLDEIKRVSEKYPHIIIIPGCITSAYYYWTGSWWPWKDKDLTAHEYDRRILAINLDEPEDYALMPNLGNEWSLKYTGDLIPPVAIFFIPVIIGFVLLKWKGRFRLIGLMLILVSTLAIIDYNPFRSSLFTAYKGDQGIAPYQELIDYVNQRGGFCFWNYPEQKSGVRKHGPIHVNTPPYPEVLHQSRDYTGFSAIYGENPTITDPGKEWDRVLNEYCIGQRSKPCWGISTADFHEDGGLGLKLGVYPTTFLVKDFSEQGVMEAIENGRMYCSRGDGRAWPEFEYFNIYGVVGKEAFMGDTLTTPRPPVIRFRVSDNRKKKRNKEISIHLIRGGTLIRTFKGETPMEIEYIDETAPPNEMTFYRIIDGKKHLTSNPIFVTYKPE